MDCRYTLEPPRQVQSMFLDQKLEKNVHTFTPYFNYIKVGYILLRHVILMNKHELKLTFNFSLTNRFEGPCAINID